MDILGIIVFCFILGGSIVYVGEKADALLQFFLALNEVSWKDGHFIGKLNRGILEGLPSSSVKISIFY